ncbi:hypothetical protein BamMEX5DRAFT_5055 [Burkholderia ambifaria MEX-5]|uniref:Uncharacterized protein n=1 Tax=Burkholderia ambifaria MEX-5 TaxID=396597 RepID=B1TB89_9BURK|nr:hypothetical protein BamMEX5DRAFT_5055 [Burkholderia ambifaria MEX-5]
MRRAEFGERLRPTGGAHGQPVLERLPADARRTGEVRERGLVVEGLERVDIRLPQHRQRRRAFRRRDDDVRARPDDSGTRRRPFGDDHMRIGAANTERAERRASRARAARPRDRLRIDREWRIVERNARTQLAEVRGRRDHAMPERETQLDQAGEAGGGIQVAELRFQRAEMTGALRARLREDLIERACLDRVAERRAGSVRFDQIDVVERCPAAAIRGGNHVGLPLRARRGETHLVAAVIIERGALDHGPDRVLVREGLRERLQDHRARAVATHRSRCVAVERAAEAVPRADHVFREDIARLLRQRDRHAADDRHLAIAVQQRQTRVVQRHQRAGTAGLHVDGRPVHVEEISDPGGEEILVVQHQQLQLAVLLADRRIGQQMLDQILAQARGGEHPDVAPGAIRRAGILQCLPHDLHQHAVLRIQQGRLRGRQVEEPRIELLDARQHAAAGDVACPIRLAQLRQLRRHLVRRERRQAVLARHQQGPQRVDVAGAGHPRAHPDDRDIGRTRVRHAGCARVHVTHVTVQARHVRSVPGGNRRASRPSRVRTGRQCRSPSPRRDP